jgi:hypothetical protein
LLLWWWKWWREAAEALVSAVEDEDWLSSG